MAERDYQEISNEDLLLEYKKTNNLELKQELTLRYVDIVKKNAIQMRDVYLSFTQVDDIINEGVIAIMSCIDKFDPSMNVKFETFVTKRIRGLIIDLARKNDWVPRGVRKTARDMDAAVSALYDRLGRYPENQEIADFLGITLDKYLAESAKTNLSNVLSLDGVLEEASDSVPLKLVNDCSDEMLPENHYLRMEQRDLLIHAIESLRDNEKLVIALYYQNELNMKDIARVLDVSEPRVSQIHANAIRKLKIYMEKQ